MTPPHFIPSSVRPGCSIHPFQVGFSPFTFRSSPGRHEHQRGRAEGRSSRSACPEGIDKPANKARHSAGSVITAIMLLTGRGRAPRRSPMGRVQPASGHGMAGTPARSSARRGGPFGARPSILLSHGQQVGGRQVGNGLAANPGTRHVPGGAGSCSMAGSPGRQHLGEPLPNVASELLPCALLRAAL